MKIIFGWSLKFQSRKYLCAGYINNPLYNDFSEEEIKPYFSEDNVLKGAFDVANKLFGISFNERKDLPVYRDNVRTFEVLDQNDKVMGIFFTDYTVRPNKGGGAWMLSLIHI